MPAAAQAARAIEAAVDRAFAAGIKPCEFGGADGTAAIAAAVLRELDLTLVGAGATAPARSLAHPHGGPFFG